MIWPVPHKRYRQGNGYLLMDTYMKKTDQMTRTIQTWVIHLKKKALMITLVGYLTALIGAARRLGLGCVSDWFGVFSLPSWSDVTAAATCSFCFLFCFFLADIIGDDVSLGFLRFLFELCGLIAFSSRFILSSDIESHASPKNQHVKRRIFGTREPPQKNL